LEAVAFDLDATLVNLGEHVEWRRAQSEIAEAYILRGCSRDDVNACSSGGLFRMLDEMWSLNRGCLGESRADEIQADVYSILDGHEEGGLTRCSPMPGCVEALNWIESRRVPMGVCTSNSQAAAEQALRLCGLREYFKVVVGRSTKHRLKPAPDQLKACYDFMGAEPTRSVMVGDSHSDVLAGKALGSYTVVVPVYFTRMEKLREAGVDAIIGNLGELPGVLARL